MAAVANTLNDIPEFNLYSVIEYNTFIESCKKGSSINGNNYCIILTANNIKYYCIITILNDSFFSIRFSNNNTCNYDNIHTVLNSSNTSFFLQLTCRDKIGVYSELKTIGIDITQLTHKNELLSKFDTIMFITCLFYRMIGITYYHILDNATGKCDKSPKTEYNLFIYRLFAKNKDNTFKYNINNMSIYYRFFNNIIYMDLNESMRINLNELTSNATHPLNKAIRTLRNIPISYNPIFTKSDPICNTSAININKMYDIINESDEFNLLIRFYVNNEDCIYYPKDATTTANAGGALHRKKIKRTRNKRLTKTSSNNRTRNPRSRMTRYCRIRKSSFS